MPASLRDFRPDPLPRVHTGRFGFSGTALDAQKLLAKPLQVQNPMGNAGLFRIHYIGAGCRGRGGATKVESCWHAGAEPAE